MGHKTSVARCVILSGLFASLLGCSSADDDATSNDPKLTVIASANLSGGDDDPDSVDLTIYALGLSVEQNCKAPNTVLTSDAHLDVAAEAGVGQSQVAPGVYPCLIVELSNQIELDNDVCDQESLTLCSGQTQSLSEETATCDDRTTLYLSTLASGDEDCLAEASCTPWLPPSSEQLDQGVKLSSGIAIEGDTTLSLVFDFKNRFSGCQVEPPALSASTLSK